MRDATTIFLQPPRDALGHSRRRSSCRGSLADPALAADPAKVLHVALTSAEMSFDPQFSADAGTDGIIDHIFDAMLDYDYLVRPVKLVPRTLVAMPSVEDGGADVCLPISAPGIHFTPDPAFKGKQRELTAGDQAYALKRLLDPAVRSPWLWLVDGKVVGASEARAKALQSGKFDYDAPIPGIEVVDRYTLRLRLRQPDLRFLVRVRDSQHRPCRARGRRGLRVRYRRASRSGPGRTCWATTAAARRSSSSPIPATAISSTHRRGRCRPNPHRSRPRSRAESFRSPAGSRSRSSRRDRPCGSPSSSASSTCSKSFP